MDNIPAPPKDTGLRNIIDKLAEFVARNGPEFETITKAKQQSNPRFSFLFGGEYYQYYQWRVSAEQSILKQQNPQTGQIPQTTQSMMQMQPNWNNIQATGNVSGSMPSAAGVNNNIASQIEAINAQQITLQEQIRQSEQNLTAQHNVLMQQQQNQIDEAIEKAQNETVLKQAEENNIRLSEFDTILQPIIDSCTKDSISTGKNWILQHAGDAAKCNVLMQYLLKKALINDVTFQQKLHLIYLVNDVLHHCVRKHADDLKSNLENIVIPMFCSAEIIASEEQKAKLLKLLSLWESKSNLFDACVISKLQSPNSSMAEYKTNLVNLHLPIVSAMQQQTQKTFEGYKQQHQIFIQHASQQITILDQQKQALKIQQSQPHPQPTQPPTQAPLTDQAQLPHLNPNECDTNQNNSINGNANNFNRNDNRLNTVPPPLMSQNISMPRTGINPNYISSQQQQRINFPAENNFQNPEPPQTSMQNSVQPMNHSAQTGHYQLPPPNFMIPDMSKPPPGFNAPPPMSNMPVGNTMDDTRNATVGAAVAAAAQPIPEDTKPTVPYYELPAGLMVPLIRLEDCSYKALDPEDIRLPAPIPPSERLLQAIEAFYSLPSHDRPRDGEGWEKLGLYEYYKVKNAAKKIKEEEVEQGIREKSRSPTPILLEPVKPKRINKRRYRSKTRSRSRSRERGEQRDRDRERERERERERDRERDREREREKERRNSRSRSISPQRPARRGNNNRRHQRQSPKRSPALRRSQTPPTSFVNFSQKTQHDCIEESNKGHQLLMKMGWSGSGLGAQGQGIETPISGGDVRDRQDQYKGVGINLNDPYENFRKNKGAAFIHRMRSRDHDRKKSKNQSNAEEEPTDY